MSKQRTCELVTKILMKTCSSLVKIISVGENISMQNKWIKYRNVLPNHKNANMGSSTVHLHGVDLIIIYHDFVPTPRRGSHVKSGKTHTHSHQDTPLGPYT